MRLGVGVSMLESSHARLLPSRPPQKSADAMGRVACARRVMKPLWQGTRLALSALKRWRHLLALQARAIARERGLIRLACAHPFGTSSVVAGLPACAAVRPSPVGADERRVGARGFARGGCQRSTGTKAAVLRVCARCQTLVWRPVATKLGQKHDSGDATVDDVRIDLDRS